MFLSARKTVSPIPFLLAAFFPNMGLVAAGVIVAEAPSVWLVMGVTLKVTTGGGATLNCVGAALESANGAAVTACCAVSVAGAGGGVFAATTSGVGVRALELG